MAKVALVLTQGFADWEYALIGGTGGPFYGLDVQYFTPQGGEIRSQGGLTATVSQDLDDLCRWCPNTLVVVGGTIWDTVKAPDISGILKSQHNDGVTIAGICGGTLALARAGILDGVPHTSNDAQFLTQNSETYAGSRFFRQSAAAVSEDRVITAPGTAPVSFAAAVFESAGLDLDTVQNFKAMMAAEHG